MEDGSKSKILNIEQKEKYEYVYNLNVERYHNFIANNVLTGDYQTDNYVTLNKNKNNVPKNNCNHVATPNGFIAIKDINVGDTIYGFDTDTLELIEQTVEKVFIKNTKNIKITHQYGEVVLSEDQKIYFNKKYILVKDLKVGDYLSLLENTEIYTPYYDIESKILKIEESLEKDIYELTVTGTHNYIYNGVLIHNNIVTYEPRRETYYVGYNWTANINDTYLQYAPIFVIYRLTYNGVQYLSDSGYPKFSRGTTASTINWNNPQLWSTY